MAGALFIGTLLGGLVLPQIPESPCPRVFQYHSSRLTGDNSVTVTGLVTLHHPPRDTAVNLTIHLQLRAVLPSKYVGLVEVLDKAQVLLYRVLFPLVKPLPSLRRVSVNGEVICQGPPVQGPVVTDITLEHSLRPLPVTPTHHQPPYYIDPGGECGRSVTSNPLVVGGRLLRRGEWPWLAAIFTLTPLGLEFHCSGSLVTTTFVLTVGHCMHHEQAGIMTAADVVVYLGKHSLQQWEEPHSIIKQVSAIHIHPEFDGNRYSADLALLRLQSPVTYNAFIQPVCLWSQPPSLDLIVGKTGTVVGWGKDGLGHKLSPTPRILEIPVVSTKECVESSSEFFFLTSSTTLCAGAKDGVGPCNGDSGSGLMLPLTEHNVTRWQLRGLVSLSLLNSTTNTCDLSQYIVFTDTAKFLLWISTVTNS